MENINVKKEYEEYIYRINLKKMEKIMKVKSSQLQ